VKIDENFNLDTAKNSLIVTKDEDYNFATAKNTAKVDENFNLDTALDTAKSQRNK